MDRIRSIVVGIDFTPCSASALRQALRIAKWNRAKVHIVHVVDPQIAEELESALSPTISDVRGSLLSEVKAEWTRFSLSIEDPSGEGAGGESARSLQLHVDVDTPLVALQKRVTTHNAELLVLGTHGTS